MTAQHPSAQPSGRGLPGWTSPRLRELLDADEGPAALEAELRRNDGVLIEPGPDDRHRLVTFVLPTDPRRAVIVLNSLTDQHREDLTDNLLQPVGAGHYRAVSMVLPRELRVTCGYALGESFPLRAEPTRQRWLSVLATVAPSPFASAPGRYSLLGGEGWVLSMDQAVEEPWRTRVTAVPQGHCHWEEDAGLCGDSPMRTWTYLPPASGPLEAVVVCSDAIMAVEDCALAAVMDDLHAQGGIRRTAVIAFEPHSFADRHELLLRSDVLGEYLLGRVDQLTAGTTAATAQPLPVIPLGASLGAAAGLCLALLHPGRIDGVIALSPSLWCPVPGTDETLLELLRADASRLRGTRLWLEYGNHETQLGPASALLGAALAEQQIPAHCAAYCGGHDAAAWRGSAARGLAALLTP